MNEKLYYPDILAEGKLKEINDYVISKLGTPIFFVVPEPTRPCSSEPCGRLYEIVTGLYIVYKDYGIKFLSEYLKFCKEKFPISAGTALGHYKGVSELRSLFCHGPMPHGQNIQEMMKALKYYLPPDENLPDENLPDKNLPAENFQMLKMLHHGAMKHSTDMVKRLSSDSNEMVKCIKECADKIAADKELHTQWKQRLLSEVMNKNDEKYGGNKNKSFFDERVVWDLVKACKKGQSTRPHKLIVKRWLEDMERVILCDEGVKQSNELYKALYDAIYSLYHPQLSQSRVSSADLLLQGFDIR